MKEKLMENSDSLIQIREKYSKDKIAELRNELDNLPEAKAFPGLTIICAGSFARLEGSEHSDIDLFFFCDREKGNVDEPRTKELSLFGKLISMNKKLGFPPFSQDAKFLEVMYVEDIGKSLGGPLDDHQNFFTARMLLLLESTCLYNERGYENVVKRIISYYYRDYPRHTAEFFPTFLLNDITRYWKTLLLNYENKRDFLKDGITDKKKTKHKIRNFKLKYSRMTTCFASIAAIGSFDETVTEEKIQELVMVTPRERLSIACKNLPKLEDKVKGILESYEWFIKQTGLSAESLESEFSSKENRITFFLNADKYGDLMYDFLDAIDCELSRKQKLIKRLVI